MESLALLAAVIMLVMILLGIVSLIAVFRRPKSSGGRGFFIAMHIASIFAGGWLMSLPVGVGARFLGLIVFAAGCVGLLRIFRGSSRS